MSTASAYSATGMVRRVAAREFEVRVTSKAFIISTAGLLVLSVVGILLVALFGGSDDDAPRARTVGVVGGTPELSQALTSTPAATQPAAQPAAPVEVSAVADEADARARIAADELDAVVLGRPDGSYAVLTATVLPSGLRTQITDAVERSTLDTALARAGVDPLAVRAEVERATVTVESLDPPDPDLVQRTFVAYVAVVLLFFSVFFYGLNVAIGVVEEKASRVVELLLSTIRPLDLLTGKVLGIGAVGLVQLVVVGGAALVASTATGLVTLGGTAVVLFVVVVLWYVLGFVFYALLYAAAGSLVSRQEDVNSVTLPLTLLSFAAFLAAQFSLNSPGNQVVEVLSWIPPFSATLMPLRIAQGDASVLQSIVTLVVMAVAAALVALLASRIYQRSVLATGSKQSLTKVLSRV